MNIYDFKIKDINGELVDLSEFKGKVLLVVNTATGCGFTPQYDGLEALYKKYKDQGLEILDFPCNQFLHQAPGSNKEIQGFCKMKFNVSFRQFSKIKVNGDEACEVYKYLKKEKGGLFGSKIKWNFTKFLINKEGKVVARYAPTKKPKKLEKRIEELLNE